MNRRAIASLLAFALVLAPSLADAKKKAKPREPDTKPPVITHVRVTKAPRGKSLMVRARFEDDSEIFAPSLYVREKGATDFETLPMRRVDNGYEAAIPAEKMGKDLEYFIEAFDEEGNGPAREGSPEAPLSIAVFDPGAVTIEKKNDTPPVEEKNDPPPEKKDPPLLRPREEPQNNVVHTDPRINQHEDDNIATTWWFWTIIGVAVTGAIAGTVVALQKGGGPVEAVDIRVIGPDPSAGL